jgi:hypothetical protein
VTAIPADQKLAELVAAAEEEMYFEKLRFVKCS